MVYVVATRGKLLKGTSRKQAFLQKRPVAIKHFCERDQSRSQITTSNYILDNSFHYENIHKYTFTGEGEKINNFNGEWELDPDNAACDPDYLGRPVFATCKNTCPGGEAF